MKLFVFATPTRPSLEILSFVSFYFASTHTSPLLPTFGLGNCDVWTWPFRYFGRVGQSQSFGFSFFPFSFDSFLPFFLLIFQCPTLAYLSSADLPPPFRLATPTGQEASIGQRQDVSDVLPSCVRPPSRWKEGFNTTSTMPTLESVGICPASTLQVV